MDALAPGRDEADDVEEPVLVGPQDEVVRAGGADGGGDLGALLGGGSGQPMNGADLDDYVTRRTIDGLFHVIADQERQIRQNPLARTSDLLRRVFK